MSKHHPNDPPWGPDQHAVLDGDRYVGRIFRENTNAVEQWFWGVDWFVARGKLAGGKLYGNAPTREAAMATFRRAWDALQRDSTPGPGKPN
jgi:hypothetical protein